MASLPPGQAFPERANCQEGSLRAQLLHLEILKAVTCSHRLPCWAGAELGRLQAPFPLRLPQDHLNCIMRGFCFQSSVGCLPAILQLWAGPEPRDSMSEHKKIPKWKILYIRGDLILSLPSSPVGHIHQEVVRSPTLRAAVLWF